MEKPSSQSRLFPRIRIFVIISVATLFATISVFSALNRKKQTPPEASVGLSRRISRPDAGSEGTQDQRRANSQNQPRKIEPDVAQMVGPVSQDRDLRDLPYIPPTPQTEEEQRLLR